MEKFKFEDQNKRLEELEIGPEKSKYDIAIIDGVLNDIKKKEQEDRAREKKDEKKKPN